ANARVPSRRSHTVCFLRSDGETLAASSPDSAYCRHRLFPRHRCVRPNAFRYAKNECAIFPAAVERPVEGAAKAESGRSNVSKFAPVAKICRRATSGQEAHRRCASAYCAAAEEIAEQ